MRVHVYRSASLQNESPPISIGIQAGCPFCRARVDQEPNTGQQILFLSGTDTGQVGTHVSAASPPLRMDQFLVKMDYQTDGSFRIVTPLSDLFIVEPFGDVPAWMPPFSIEDALALHEAILMTFDRSRQETGTAAIPLAIHPIVATCWWRRMPISSDEAWGMLAAHGFDVLNPYEFSRFFSFGIELLIATHGRKPIRKRRMEPLSRPRYLPPKQREFWINFFGHD